MRSLSRVSSCVRLAAVAGLAASLLRASAAYGQTPAIDLVWNAPAECPSRDTVLGERERILGASRAVNAEIARTDVYRNATGGWHAQVQVESRGARTAREFDAQSCSEIAAATAVILAVAAEDFPGGAPSAGQEPATTPSGESPRTASLATAPAPVPVPAAPPADGSGTVAESPRFQATGVSRLVLAAGGVLDEGAMPSPSAGAELEAGWLGEWGRLRVRASWAAGFFPQRATFLANHPGEGGNFQLFALSGRACVGTARGPLEVAPCVGAEMDAMQASGIGSSIPGNGSAAWGALLASGRAGLRLSQRFGVGLRVEGVLPLARPQFVVQTPTTDLDVHRPASVGFRAALCAETFFF
jgi:hypothetical protein